MLKELDVTSTAGHPDEEACVSPCFANEEMRDYFVPEDALRKVHSALAECFSAMSFDVKRTAAERLHYSKLARHHDEQMVSAKYPLGERDPWDPKAFIPLVQVNVSVTGRKPRVKQAKASSKARRRGQSAKRKAKLIGANRSTMRRAMNSLVMAGIVAAEATRNGTVLRLVA